MLIAKSRPNIAVLILSLTIALAAMLSGRPSHAQNKPSEVFQSAAPHAILIDADSDTVLYEKNADQLVYPASLTKLMTTELVFHLIKEGKVKLTDEFTITEDAWRRGGAPSHGSTMFAAIHSRVSVDNLLHGIIIQSGNDACIAIAEGIAGTEAEFARMMTKRAREIGLTKSTFTNSTGLHDPELKVTPRELAKLAQYIIQHYPEFYKIYGQTEFTWNKIRQLNRNPLLAMNIGADGLKTGFTKEANYNLVGSAVQNGLRLIVVVTGVANPKQRADEARKLLEFGFRGFESRYLFDAEETIGEAKLFGGRKGRVPLIAGRPVRLLVPRGTNDRIVGKVVYTGPVRAPVAKDQQIGDFIVWRNDVVALKVPLHAADAVPVGSLPQRAFDAASELVISVIRAGVERL